MIDQMGTVVNFCSVLCSLCKLPRPLADSGLALHYKAGRAVICTIDTIATLRGACATGS
jgi:hypothetical protein